MKQFVKKATRVVNDLMNSIQKDAIGAYSAQAAFFVVTSMVPLLMLLLTLVKYLPYFSDGIPMIQLDILPHDINVFITQVIQEIVENSTRTIMSVSAVTALWSASKGVFSIMQGLRAAYYTNDKRNYVVLRLLSILYTVVFLIVLVAALGFLVFGNIIYQALMNYLPLAAESAKFITAGIKWLLGFGVLVFFFEVMYILVPKRKSTIIQELPGALISAVGWIVFSYGYSFYIEKFSNYGSIYGSLTALILLMLWVYFCMYIMLFGAEVNVAWNKTYKKIAARLYNNTKNKIKQNQTKPSQIPRQISNKIKQNKRK